MKFYKSLYLVGLSLSILWVAGCSMNLTRGDLEDIPLTQEKYSFFGNIPFIYGKDTLQLDENLLKAYTAAADSADFPRKQCRGEASISVSVTQNTDKSEWILATTVIPFWPVLPVNETWTYNLAARIFCEGTLVRHLEFKEDQTIRATLYGRLRTDLLNEASASMHRKLVERLRFELGENRPADLNSASDF